MSFSLKNASISFVLLFLIMQVFPILFSGYGAFIYYSALSITAVVVTFVALFINFHLRQRNLVEQAPAPLSHVLLWGIIGTFLALFTQILASLFETIVLKQPMASSNTETLLEVIRHYPYFVIATSLTSPIMEELVFRKVIFGNLIPHTGKIGAAVIASTLFSLAHFDGHFLIYATIGFVFCYLYQKTQSIYTSMIAHILMNTLAIVVQLK